MASEFYELGAATPQGRPVSMADYKGKVVLVVNTATQCGFTPQFEGLEKLYRTYKDKGLVILGFPCNQFGGQEPLANEVMEQTCAVNYGVSFPLFEKIEVNGAGAHPVFRYLKKQLGGLFWEPHQMELYKIPDRRAGEAGEAVFTGDEAGGDRAADPGAVGPRLSATL